MLSKLKKNHILIICFLYATSHCYSQKELLYISTDKDVYHSGEVIKFRVLALTSMTHKPSHISNIIYFQILNFNGKSVTIEKFPINKGVYNGQYKLPENIGNGLYFINVLTVNSVSENLNYRSQKPFYINNNKFKNISIAYDFSLDTEKEILYAKIYLYNSNNKKLTKVNTKLTYKTKKGKRKSILNTSDSLGLLTYEIKSLKDIDIRRFELNILDEVYKTQHVINLDSNYNDTPTININPDKKNLFYNYSQNLNVELFNEWNEPKVDKVFLFRDEVIIDSTKTNNRGLGKFEFHPKIGYEYSLSYNKTFRNKKFLINNIKDQGIDIEIKQDKDFLEIKLYPVHLNFDFKCKAELFFRNIKIDSFTSILNKNKEIITLPITKLTSGKMKIKLRDEKNKKIAEKQFFVNKFNQIEIEPVGLTQSKYKPNKNVKLKFKISNYDKNSDTNLFARVTNDRFLAKNYNLDLKSFSFLIKNLSSKKFKPKEYFQAINKDSTHNLDLLIYKSDKVTDNNKTSKSLLFESFRENIYGQLYKRTPNGTLILEKKVNIPVIGSEYISAIKVDSTGFYTISPETLKLFKSKKSLLAYGSNETHVIRHIDYIDSINKINSLLNLGLTKNVDYLSKKNYYPNSYQKHSLKYLNTLDEVEISTIKSKNNKKNVHISQDDYVCYEFDVLNCVNHLSGYKPVDGETYWTNVYATPIQVTFIKPKIEEEPTFNIVELIGFYPETFSNLEKNELVDLRTNLYWGKKIKINPRGEFEIEFRTSEIRGYYIGKIEANDSNGFLGSYYFNFEVND